MLARLRLLLLTLGLAFLGAGSLQAADAVVVIVSSERSASYVEAAEALAGELERGGLTRRDVLQITAAELPAAGTLTPRLFVALGTDAASLLAKGEGRAPILCTLLPRISFDRIVRETGRRPSPQFSALYLNQPFTRQLDLIRLALPNVRRVGVLWGPESQMETTALQVAAQARGLELVSARVGPNEPLFPGLKRVLEDADLLLAVADPQLYNGSSLQNILLASFRARVPMVAFSPAYVRAGALLAVHTTPSQIGRQAAVMVRHVLAGKALPATPQYPQDFSISVNEHVARSLGLALESNSLGERLRELERGK